MTTEEFDIWFKAHRLAFPELSEWLRASEDAAAVIAMWREVLGNISLANAKSVTARMLSGSLEHPDRWNCSKLPGIVLANTPKRLPSADEVNHPTHGWSPYRGMGKR